MRMIAAVVGVVLAATLAVGQTPPREPDVVRDPIRLLPEQFGQATPKDALDSAIRLIDRGRLDYLAAHLLDPAFVNARVADRALRIEGDVEREYRRLRDAQRLDPSLPGDQRLPDEPKAFAKKVQAEATVRGFRQLVADIRTTLAENPDHVADLRRFLRSGQLLEAGDTAGFALKDVKDRTVNLKRTAAGWHLEDRRQDALPPEKK